MARNKYPQETVDKILDVSSRLFMEKGYERTTIQDIIDHLGGLSKGAIYHHFKSKEDILVAVTDRMTADSDRRIARICERSDLNGREKLKTIFKESICCPSQDNIFTAAPDLSNNPRLVYSTIRDTMDVTVPRYILPIIREGVADGSIQTEYPEELAELLLLTANIWLNPMFFNSTAEQISRKYMVFDQMLKGFGMDILDEEMRDRLMELAQIYQDNK